MADPSRSFVLFDWAACVWAKVELGVATFADGFACGAMGGVATSLGRSRLFVACSPGAVDGKAAVVVGVVAFGGSIGDCRVPVSVPRADRRGSLSLSPLLLLCCGIFPFATFVARACIVVSVVDGRDGVFEAVVRAS